MSDTDQLSAVIGQVQHAILSRRSHPVAPQINEAALAARLARYDFHTALPMETVTEDLLDLLQANAVRSDHPRYFGLFNPPPLPAAIAGDLVAAAINPQLAVWSHAPAAVEIERRIVRLFGTLIWSEEDTPGTFTSGGSEANLTALLSALASRYPDWETRGLGGRRPAIFVSSESHLAWIKIARMCGLGSEAVRLVKAEDGLRLTAATLRASMDGDSDLDPLLLVATAGTTAHGAIDDIAGIAQLAREKGAHMHVDAAWAGGLLLDPARRSLFPGIEQADSVTIDPHKMLAVPMGAGLYLCRDWTALGRAFAVATGYMPSASSERHDPYIHSVQWSRRFIGGKVFVALASLGLPGYQRLFERQFALGDRLRSKLLESGWQICNDTPLPVVCFAPAEGSDAQVPAIAADVVASGEAWLSVTQLRNRPVLRACITSFETSEADIDHLVDLLNRKRNASASLK
jgi:aromatic-L-amino-acid decarboxylase